MGYGGKYVERARARELRAQSWTLKEICEELGVSKSSVSVWVRDVEFNPRPRNRGHPAGPYHPMRLKKQAEIEQSRLEAEQWVGQLTSRELTMFALALYAGEGTKGDGGLVFANSDPRLIVVFLLWLRAQFDIPEPKFRLRMYLHADLDLDAAQRFWERVTGIPIAQFDKPYRAAADNTMRSNRHIYGCVGVAVHSRLLQRRVLAMIEAVTSQLVNPG